jgi:lactoylglutathione lyase
LISFEQDRDAVSDAQMRGIGYRYLTIQVFDVVAEHRAILARGGAEGAVPVRLGDVAYISFVRDPDGNWIEISQRKSITGSLD